MTKKVRIENADTSDFKVVVEVWEQYGENPPTLVETHKLDYPTALTPESLYLTGSRYLVVKEV